MTLSVRNLFARNLGLKFVSLILAVVLWYMAVGRERAEVGINVPLELVNIPKDKVISNQVVDAVNIRVSGSVTLARQVTDRKLRFSLDLSGAIKGPNEFTLRVEQLALPRGLEVTRLAPAKVTVELEDLVVKNVSLLPVIMGEPPAGYIIDDITLEPKSVAVRGPESVVRNLDILWTEPVEVTRFKEPVTVKTRPALPQVSLSLVEPVEIKAQLGIIEKTIIQEFKDVPVDAFGEQAADIAFSLNPKTVDLVIKGPVNTMPDLMIGENLTARINLAGLAQGRHERMVIVSVPPKFEILKVEPRLIGIEIKPPPVRKPLIKPAPQGPEAKEGGTGGGPTEAGPPPADGEKTGP